VRDGALDQAKLNAISQLLNPLDNVFVDLLHNRRGDGAAEWLRRLEMADFMVVCWTPGMLESPWVRREIATAFALEIPTAVIDELHLRRALENLTLTFPIRP
jgi:hypothetical protein